MPISDYSLAWLTLLYPHPLIEVVVECLAMRLSIYPLPELGTANLHSIPQPQIPQNCKRCSATANPKVCDRFAVTFRTSATANAHCTSANLDHIIYCYFVFVMTFFIFEGQILPSTRRRPPKEKKIKGHQLPDVNLQPRK